MSPDDPRHLVKLLEQHHTERLLPAIMPAASYKHSDLYRQTADALLASKGVPPAPHQGTDGDGPWCESYQLAGGANTRNIKTEWPAPQDGCGCGSCERARAAGISVGQRPLRRTEIFPGDGWVTVDAANPLPDDLKVGDEVEISNGFRGTIKAAHGAFRGSGFGWKIAYAFSDTTPDHHHDDIVAFRRAGER